MIVCKANPAWKIIFQPAHALLAGKIYSKITASIKCHAPIETFLAISTHDDYPEDFQPNARRYITESGAPRDFTEMDMSESLRFNEAVLTIQTAKRKSTWMGLLRSYHAHTLYNNEDISKPFRKLIDDEMTWRANALRFLKLRKSDLEDTYSIMEFCDRCSLILCKGELPAMCRQLEISKMVDTQYLISKSPEETISVSPWPFEETQFSMEVEARKLAEISFDDDAALGSALDETRPDAEQFIFKKG